MAEIFRRETALFGDRGLDASLSELFHENTKLRHPMIVPTEGQAAFYGLRAMEAMACAYKRYRSYPQTPLPPVPASLVGPPIADVIAARRSTRNFAQLPLELGELAALLQWSYGMTGEAIMPGGARQRFRAVPSAGALYPAELYLGVRAVSGLEPGVYHYEVPSASLALLNRGDPTPLLHEACCRQDYACQAGVVVLMSAVVERTRRKYGERGYRYALLEVGHLAENLHLACTALGLAMVTTGAFFDDDLADLLEIDGCDEAVMYVAFIGKRGGEAD
jgi:SagB-type dehydrogenase family enzyme